MGVTWPCILYLVVHGAGNKYHWPPIPMLETKFNSEVTCVKRCDQININGTKNVALSAQGQKDLAPNPKVADQIFI